MTDLSESKGMLAKLERMQLKATGKLVDRADVVNDSHPKEPQDVRSIQLPLWPEAVRGVPNSILRSALFGAIRRGRRPYLSRVELASVDGVTVFFKGERLDQSDLDVWEQCLHLARGQAIGERIVFNAYSFLKGIGRSSGGKDVEWLKLTFLRLSGATVEIKDGKRSYFGPMLLGGARDDRTGMYSIEINANIVALYGRDGWTQIEWQERKALKGMPLAQWLHGFYTTHAKPYSYKVETLHSLCGSEAKNLKDFRKDLRNAFEHLDQATGWSSNVSRDGLVTVTRKPSASQALHLANKAQAPRKPRRGGALTK